MDRIKYFPYSAQKYIKLHSLHFLCVYAQSFPPRRLLTFYSNQKETFDILKHGLQS